MKMNFPGKTAFEQMVSEKKVEKKLIMKQQEEARVAAEASATRTSRRSWGF